MLKGTQVRVIRPPLGREDLISREGTVSSLIPVASTPLQYNISFGDSFAEEIVPLPANAVKILDYIEDGPGPNAGPGDMIVVNGLSYCNDHRLEICGHCGYNFRLGNLIQELEGNFDMAEQLDQQLMLAATYIGSIRRAPTMENATTQPFDLYHPVVNDAIVVVPPGLNPDALEDFPRDKLLQNCYWHQFAMDDLQDQLEEPSTRPLGRVRRMFFTMALQLDEYRASQTNPQDRFRTFLQNEAQSEGLTMDIMSIKLHVCKLSSGNLWRWPIIVVGWSQHNAGNTAAIMKSVAAMERGTIMREIKAQPHEMALFAKILESNANKLDPTYRHKLQRQLDPSGRNVGVIAPISCSNHDKYYQLLEHYCDFCTASSGCQLFRCSRCKSVEYCSKECQKRAWKRHKKICLAAIN